MGRLDHFTRLEIVRLHRSGYSGSSIRQALSTRGIIVARNTISYWINQYRSGHFGDVTECAVTVPRSFNKVSVQDAQIIVNTFSKDPNQSCSDVHKQLKADGASFSLSTTKRAVFAAGYTNSKPRYAQMVREPNKVKRVNFCKDLLEANENFKDVIFSDESTIQLHTNKSTSYHVRGAAPQSIPKPKHPLKVHVWAAISRKGASRILVFDGIMESTFFTTSILQDTLLDFVNRKFRNGHRFQQDNDPKHKSNLSRKFMEDNGINWWDVWPSESPDLNPIEMAWNQLKRHVARTEPKTKEELEETIESFWTELMTVEQCNLYIDHVYKVVPVCIALNGQATANIPNRLFSERSRGKSISYFAQQLTYDMEQQAHAMLAELRENQENQTQ